jgi:hypothetical protein
MYCTSPYLEKSKRTVAIKYICVYSHHFLVSPPYVLVWLGRRAFLGTTQAKGVFVFLSLAILVTFTPFIVIVGLLIVVFIIIVFITPLGRIFPMNKSYKIDILKMRTIYFVEMKN